jgi:hypothetical protein
MLAVCHVRRADFDVGLGSKEDIVQRPSHVRFATENER